MIPLPLAYVGAVAAGAAAGVAFEYVTSMGQASQRDLVVGGVMGALPVGLGARATVKLVQKGRKLHKFGKYYQPGVLHYSGKVIGAATQRPGLFPNLSLRPEMVGITSGVAASYVVGQLYDASKSRPGEHTSRSGTPETGKSIPGASAQKGRSRPSSKKPGRRTPLADRRGPATSRERRPRTVRYRKGGCPPGYRYDRRRRMCVLTN